MQTHDILLWLHTKLFIFMIVDKLERLKEDAEYPSFWYASYANQIIDLLNALRRLEVVGGKVVWADANVKLIFSGSANTGPTPVTGSGDTYVSSSIYCLARWA